jgi:hypothetical protein
MEEVHCDRCGATWLIPAALDPEARRAVASLIRSGGLIPAIRHLREVTGLGLRDAKAVVQHITRTPGKCHRCGEALIPGAVDPCPRCRSLNCDW